MESTNSTLRLVLDSAVVVKDGELLIFIGDLATIKLPAPPVEVISGRVIVDLEVKGAPKPEKVLPPLVSSKY